MSFFARVLNHLVNEVLVNSLANNRTFQQLAVRSNAWVAEMAKKSEPLTFHEHPRVIEHLPSASRPCAPFSPKLAFAGAEHQKKLGQQAQDFHKTFREEVTALVAPITMFSCRPADSQCVARP